MSRVSMGYVAASVGALLLLCGAGYAVYLFTRPGAARSVGGALVGSAVNVVAGGVEKIVEAPLVIGDAVGLPRTNMSKCEKALADGRLWDASFDCPAGTFLGGLWDKATK